MRKLFPFLFTLCLFAIYQSGNAQQKCFNDPLLGQVCISGELSKGGCFTIDNRTITYNDKEAASNFLAASLTDFKAEIDKEYKIRIRFFNTQIPPFLAAKKVQLKKGDELLDTKEIPSTWLEAEVEFTLKFEEFERNASRNYGVPLHFEFIGPEFSTGPDIEKGSISLPVVITGSKLVNGGEILGYTQSPSIPYLILRKPPGNQSYTEFTKSDQVCYGFSMSTNEQVTAGVDASIKVGAKVSAGFIVSTESEVYAEASASLEMGIGQEKNDETTFCFTTEEGFTAEGGDLYVIYSPRYAIGKADIVELECGNATFKTQVTLAPTGEQNLQLLSEREIKEVRIPQLEREIAAGTGVLREKKQAQLDVWRQALQMNLNAKANLVAPLSIEGSQTGDQIGISGGGFGRDFSQTSTTSKAETITTTFFMDSEVAVRAGFEVGGSGAEVGVSMGLSLGGSNSSTSATEQTNTVHYHINDDSEEDFFDIRLGNDPLFGTPVFRVLNSSRTSCPYEGGQRRYKPRMRINGKIGNQIFTGANLNGEQFTLEVCNLSETGETLSYNIRVPGQTTAIITRGGESLRGAGISTGDIPPGECRTEIITVMPPNNNELVFEDIEITMMGECVNGEEEEISSASFSMYFGDAGAVANDNPCNAILLNVDGSIFPSTTTDATTLPNEESIVEDIPFSSGRVITDKIFGWPETSILATVWFKFVAPESGKVDISTCELGLTSPKFAVFDVPENGCGNFQNYSLVAAYTMDSNRDCGNLGIVDNLVPGKTYYIMVAGFDWADRDFGIRIQEGASIDITATFRVDMTGQNLTNALHLYCDFGELAGFEPDGNGAIFAYIPMIDPDGDNIFEAEVRLPNMPTAGRDFFYIYTDGRDFGRTLEPRNGNCYVDGFFTNIRGFSTPSNGSSSIIMNDCYGTCECSLSFTPDCGNWDLAGQEGDFLDFEGEKLVRYGANGNFAYGTFTDGTPCDVSLFGDVAPNVFKSCWLCQPTVVEDISSGVGLGLRGTYYNDLNLSEEVLSRIDETVNFSWGLDAPSALINADIFSVKWEGEVEAGFSERYTFYTSTDDGVRLWVDDQLIIDQWIDQGTTEHSGQINLEAGKRVMIRMEYYENTGGATARLSWASTNLAKEIIPRRNLFPAVKAFPECANPALGFDGIDDYIDLGESLGDFGTKDFTIEFTVQTTQTITNPSFSHIPLITKRDGCNCSNFLYISLQPDGTCRLDMSGDANCAPFHALETQSVINDGLWHHIAVRRSGDRLFMYMDGQLEGETGTSSMIDLANSGRMQVGKSDCTDAGFGGIFEGKLDEVRIWDVARSDAQIKENRLQELSGKEFGLLAYYNFNDGVPNGDNTGRPATADLSIFEGIGVMENFERNGNSSNWLPGNEEITQLDRDGNDILDACDEPLPISTSIVEPTVPGVVLGQNFPNPFKEQTVIPVSLPNAVKDVQIRIMAIDGRVIRMVHKKASGLTRINFEAKDLATGVYFYSLFIDGQLQGTKRMLLVK